MRTARQYRKDLDLLTKEVKLFLAQFDVEMSKPSTRERGERVAKLTNDLELANDIAIRYGLAKK